MVAPRLVTSRIRFASKRSHGRPHQISLSYGAHSNLCVNQIRLNGTPEQKDALSAPARLGGARRRIGDVGSGRRIGCRLNVADGPRSETTTTASTATSSGSPTAPMPTHW